MELLNKLQINFLKYLVKDKNRGSSTKNNNEKKLPVSNREEIKSEGYTGTEAEEAQRVLIIDKGSVITFLPPCDCKETWS